MLIDTECDHTNLFLGLFVLFNIKLRFSFILSIKILFKFGLNICDVLNIVLPILNSDIFEDLCILILDGVDLILGIKECFLICIVQPVLIIDFLPPYLQTLHYLIQRVGVIGG